MMTTVMTTVCKASGCDFESTQHYDVASHGYVAGPGHYQFESLHRSQVVVAYPDSSYTVRTYVLRDGRWDLLRERPADPRSVAQATIDGRLAVAEVQGSADRTQSE